MFVYDAVGLPNQNPTIFISLCLPATTPVYARGRERALLGNQGEDEDKEADGLGWIQYYVAASSLAC